MTTKNIIAEYVWIGGNGELRSKARTLVISSIDELSVSNLPEWNYDGSSTNQAPGHSSEVILKPGSVFKCPFRGDFNILVMCSTYKPDGTPLNNNYRHNAVKLFNKNLLSHPWYGLEQEYFLIDPKTNKPLGFPEKGYPEPQGQYYCSVGTNNAFGRKVVEKHYKYCLKAGIKISGINAEVAPGQWEFQVGPCEGIDSGDHLWMARYILNRVAEEFNVIINYEPKPLKGDWNGSGCHTNYSTVNMRRGTETKTGLEYISEAITKLSKNHAKHIVAYGDGNKQRLTGKHETASFDKFSYGEASRDTSIRIPSETVKNKKGYLEDRRPASNMDPYLVTSIIFDTTVLN